MELLNFIVEISIPLLVGLSVSSYLRSVTTRLLNDLCGTQDRSVFWVRVTAILMTGFPLLLVLTFGRSGNPAISTGDVARHALLMTTFGIVVSVAVLAKMIMDSIPKTVAGTVSIESTQ